MIPCAANRLTLLYGEGRIGCRSCRGFRQEVGERAGNSLESHETTLEPGPSDATATVTIHNCGPQIAEDLIERIFEYGVSDQAEAGAAGNRGQGLFVAKTYLAKMGGTIAVRNVADGVCFRIALPRAGGERAVPR